MFTMKAVEKIKTHVSYSETFFFFSKIVAFMSNAEKCGGTREVTDDIIRRMRFAC